MLQNSALIVSLSISQWSARKLDKKVTDEINISHNATADAGRYNKLLVSKAHTEAVQKITGKARTFHYENTLAWGDNNERLLPTANYMKYVQEMGMLKGEFDAAIAAFFSNYDAVIVEARIRLNGMFRDSDYPSKGDIQDKFAFNTSFMPVPSSDIRVGLSDSIMDALRANVETEINSRLGDAVKGIWERIKTQLSHMRDKLSTKDAIFRDSLFDNLTDLIELLPALNVTNDVNIAKICNEMKGLVVSPDSVRTNVALRITKADEVDAVMNKFKGFF